MSNVCVNWRVYGTFLLCAVVAVGGEAFGQSTSSRDDRGSQAPKSDTQESRNLLAGPAVEPEAAANGQARRQNGQNVRREPRVQPQQWFAALREIELTPDQQPRIREIANAYQRAMREFHQRHGEELRRLRAENERSQPVPELRQKVQRLEAARPKADEYQRRIWAELGEMQQQTLRKKLDEIHQRQQQRRRAGAEMSSGKTDSADHPMSGVPGVETKSTTKSQAKPRSERDDRRGNGQRLDELARRRLEFLRSRQTGNRPGRPPTQAERRFTFDENDTDKR